MLTNLMLTVIPDRSVFLHTTEGTCVLRPTAVSPLIKPELRGKMRVLGMMGRIK